MTEHVPTVRSGPPPTRRILQGLGSLVLIVAIFWFLFKGIAFGQVWAAIRALTWLELATLAAVAGWNLCTYALVWMSVTPGLGFWPAMVMTQSTTAVANTVPGAGPVIGIGIRHTPTVPAHQSSTGNDSRLTSGPSLRCFYTSTAWLAQA